MPNSTYVPPHAEYTIATHKPMITSRDVIGGLFDLRLQNHRLQVALNNVTQGVCFFDGSRRLILANRRYAEIYELPFESIQPGTSLEEIVEHRCAVGSMPHTSAEEYLAWRAKIQLEGLPSDTVVEMMNGRVVFIRRRPMPDLGWVSTHEDITDLPHRQSDVAAAVRNSPSTQLNGC